MRPIDADRLKAVLDISFGGIGGAAVLTQLIDDAPTIDTAPVVHGLWIEKSRHEHYPSCKPYKADYCSVCGKRGSAEYRYCPNCGAKLIWEK